MVRRESVLRLRQPNVWTRWNVRSLHAGFFIKRSHLFFVIRVCLCCLIGLIYRLFGMKRERLVVRRHTAQLCLVFLQSFLTLSTSFATTDPRQGTHRLKYMMCLGKVKLVNFCRGNFPRAPYKRGEACSKCESGVFWCNDGLCTGN